MIRQRTLLLAAAVVQTCTAPPAVAQCPWSPAASAVSLLPVA